VVGRLPGGALSARLIDLGACVDVGCPSGLHACTVRYVPPEVAGAYRFAQEGADYDSAFAWEFARVGSVAPAYDARALAMVLAEAALGSNLYVSGARTAAVSIKGDDTGDNAGTGSGTGNDGGIKGDDTGDDAGTGNGNGKTGGIRGDNTGNDAGTGTGNGQDTFATSDELYAHALLVEAKPHAWRVHPNWPRVSPRCGT
jgi:hypothetical protein